MAEYESAGDDVASPCIGICRLDPAGICVGCFRTMDEIIEWPAADRARRVEIRHAADARQAGKGTQDT